MPLVVKLFEAAVIEFTETNLIDLVDVMDLNGTGAIDEQEFTRAICTYASGVKPLSVQEINFNICMVSHKLDRMQDHISHIARRVGGDEVVEELEQEAAAEMEKLHTLGRMIGVRSQRRKPSRRMQKIHSETMQKRHSEPCGARKRAGGSRPCSERPTLLGMKVVSISNLGSPAADTASDAKVSFGLPSQPSTPLPCQAAPSTAELLASLERRVQECSAQHLEGQSALEQAVRARLDDLREQLREDTRRTMLSVGLLPLPGGFFVGERVRALIDFQSEFGSVKLGDIGIVMGRSTCRDDGRVNIDFPRLVSVNMLPRQLAKEPAGDVLAAASRAAAPSTAALLTAAEDPPPLGAAATASRLARRQAPGGDPADSAATA